MKWQWLVTAFMLLMLVVSWTVSREANNGQSFENAKDIIAMREIGHLVLLASGDSVSRVLPVRQTGDNIFDLKFESRFSFMPDSLVAIIHRSVEASHFTTDYVVQVLECDGNEVVYGYAMEESRQSAIIPCLGREMEKNCYTIRIVFPKAAPAHFSRAGFMLPLTFSLFALSVAAGYFIRRRKKPAIQEENIAEPESTAISIGQYRFFFDQQLLRYGSEQIELTVKEAKVLNIFAAVPNQVIDRNRLLKEGWEDEGVIVGRSLDMFVSKLRKKLQKDPAVKISNVHGKGYRLEISCQPG